MSDTALQAEFTAMIAPHERLMRSYAFKLVGQSRAEDVMQSALMAAWKRYTEGFRPEHPRAYLMTAVKNTAYNLWKKTSNNPTITIIDDEQYGTARNADPFVIVSERETYREVLTKLSTLPERQREALLDTTVRGMSHAESAEHLNVSEGNARMLAYRAKNTMLDRIEGQIAC